MVAVAGLEPECLDARLDRGALDTVVAPDPGLRLDEALRARGQQIGFQRSIGALERQRHLVEPVARVIVHGPGIGRLGREMRVVDFEVQEQIAFSGSELHAGGRAGRAGQRPRVRRNVPVLAIAVEQRLHVQRIDIEVALVRGERLPIVHVAEGPGRLGGERMSDRVRARLQRALLRAAQGVLELTRILAAGPRQDQRGERDDQQLNPDAHSIQR